MTATLFLAPLVKRDWERRVRSLARWEGQPDVYNALLRGYASDVSEVHGVSMDAAMAALRESVK